MAGDSFDHDLARKLEKLAATPDGLLLQTMAPMFGGFDTMVPMLKPMLIGIGADLIETLAQNFDLTEIVDVDTVRGEIDKVLTERMTTLFKKITNKMIANCRNYVMEGADRSAAPVGPGKLAGRPTCRAARASSAAQDGCARPSASGQ